jgi:hypothetical protein
LKGRSEDEVADRDPEVIKAEIAQARDRLAVTVDSLAERANPQRVADDLKSAVLRFVKQPAVAAALAGVGVITVVIVVRSFRR